MEEADLARIVTRHNALAAAKALAWLVVAAAAWFASWWAIWLLFFVPTTLWGLWPSLETCSYVAWGGLALLAVEGVFYGRKLFDLEGYNRSLYFRIYSGGEEKIPIRTGRYSGNPLGMAYLVSQMLFIAPRATVNVARSLRSLVFMDADARRQAEAALKILSPSKGWVSSKELTWVGLGLYPLHKLRLIETRVTDAGDILIRLDREPEPAPPDGNAGGG